MGAKPRKKNFMQMLPIGMGWYLEHLDKSRDAHGLMWKRNEKRVTQYPRQMMVYVLVCLINWFVLILWCCHSIESYNYASNCVERERCWFLPLRLLDFGSCCFVFCYSPNCSLKPSLESMSEVHCSFLKGLFIYLFILNDPNFCFWPIKLLHFIASLVLDPTINPPLIQYLKYMGVIQFVFHVLQLL